MNQKNDKKREFKNSFENIPKEQNLNIKRGREEEREERKISEVLGHDEKHEKRVDDDLKERKNKKNKKEYSAQRN